MEKQKRFKKQELNSDDYKGMEQGAKALKVGLGTLASVCLLVLASVCLLVKNKDILKSIGKSVLNLTVKVTKR